MNDNDEKLAGPVGCVRPEALSGWILPDGSYLAVDEWWHVACLYDLKDAGKLPELALPEHAAVLDSGDESRIRDLASRLGLVKISRGEIDAYAMSDKQLETLKDELGVFDPEFEFRLLIGGGQQVQMVSVGRIMKLRSARALFGSPPPGS